jgi:uncharacterized RDD family membrane protein YckC
MYCTKCGAAVQGTFCTNCGTLASPAAAPAGTTFPPPPPPAAGYGPAAPVVADIGTRVLAFLVDIIPILIVGAVFRRIPILGRMIMGAISAAYWLLRDFNGASLGKMAFGLMVVKKDGSPAGTNDRILRNVTLAVGPALQIIPFIGLFIAIPIGIVMGLTELLVLIVKRERLGDILAGTTVIRKPV